MFSFYGMMIAGCERLCRLVEDIQVSLYVVSQSSDKPCVLRGQGLIVVRTEYNPGNRLVRRFSEKGLCESELSLQRRGRWLLPRHHPRTSTGKAPAMLLPRMNFSSSFSSLQLMIEHHS